MTLFKTIAWIKAYFAKNESDNSDNISLEVLNNKIRLVVWFFLLLHMLTVTFFSETRLPTPFYITCFVVWFSYLYLLLKTKNEFIKGLPFLIVNFGVALSLILKGESYFLRLTTFSLPSLPIYSVQGYPPALTLILGSSYFAIHKHYYLILTSFTNQLQLPTEFQRSLSKTQ